MANYWESMLTEKGFKIVEEDFEDGVVERTKFFLTYNEDGIYIGDVLSEMGATRSEHDGEWVEFALNGVVVLGHNKIFKNSRGKCYFPPTTH